MKLKWILLAVSLIIFLGPLGTALVMYRNNLLGLVIPDVSGLLGEQGFKLEYADCQLDLTGSSMLKLKVINPFNVKLKLNSISMEVLCSEHSISLGYASRNTPQDILAKTTVIIELQLTFTPQGQAHIYSEHLGSDLYIDLKNAKLNISGMEISSDELGNRLGPIGIP